MAEPLTILDTQLVQSTLVACGTLLVYDFMCTLDQEVAHIWTSPWTVGTVLFFLNRYLPFIDTFLSLKLKLSVNTPDRCQKEFTVVTWLIVAGIIISEVILALRTYAIWQRKRLVLIILCLSSAITFIPAIVVTHIELKSLIYVPSEFPGCRLSTASSIIIVAYILLALSETIMAVLTGIEAYRHLRHSQSRWVLQLYQEGLLFYIYLLCISLANILVPILAPRIFANWLATPQRVMHSVLCNRVLLLILKQRSSSNMTNRVHRFGEALPKVPVFESFVDEGVSANMTIVAPTVDTVHLDTELQEIEQQSRT